MITKEQITEVKKYAYEKRIVAFVDILGWKKATELEMQCHGDVYKAGLYGTKIFIPCDCLGHTLQKIKAYAMMFSEEIKETLQNSPGISGKSFKEHAGIEFSFFSDCFAVSAPVDYAEKIFEILSWASHDLLRKKFSVRGGITIGDLFHCNGIVFGPALVEAVRLEKDEAGNACSLLCSDKLKQYLEQTDCKKRVIIDYDQKLVVNIALGTPDAENDLMAVINEKLTEIMNELGTLDTNSKEFTDLQKAETKWKYLQKMLPKMYEDLAFTY